MVRIWLVLSVTALALAASAHAEVRLQKVGDFDQPVYVTGAPGDDRRLFVVERRGMVQAVADGVAAPFLDLRDVVQGPGDAAAGGEEGLLSIAFAPDYTTSRLLYVFYTEVGGDANRVEELRVGPDGVADPSSRRLVISLPHDLGTHHNGGQLQFGPDGLLYIATGDGGNGGALARDLGNLHGKLLRIDPRASAGRPYTVPAGNPFVGQAGRRGAIWAYGLRNPFRFSFDRLAGDLTVGDVGESTSEEIDYLPFDEGRGLGADFGWNVCEGPFVRGASKLCTLAHAVRPVLYLRRTAGFKAVVNGYVVRDRSLPSLYGRFVYGDFYVDALRSAQLRTTFAIDDREIGPLARVPRLTSFGEDAGGCLYAASYNGPVYRLVENDARIPCATVTPQPPRDHKPPLLLASTGGHQHQRPLRRGGVVVSLGCDEGCRVRVAGFLRVGKRSYFLGAKTGAVAADTRSRVRLPLTARARRAMARALARRQRPFVRLHIRARDANGRWAPTAVKTVRVRR